MIPGRPLRRLAGWLLAPGAPESLAALRIAIWAAWLVCLHPEHAAHFAAYPKELLSPPGLWHERVTSIAGTPEAMHWLYVVFVPAALAAMLGYRTMLSSWIALFTGGWLLSVPNFYGRVDHENHLLWAAMLLAVSPSADAWSIDAWRSRRAARREVRPSPAPRAAYGIPVRIVWILLAIVYFFPGYWKLATVGLHWCTDENLARLLHYKWALLEWTPSLRIDQWRGVCAALAWSTVAFECTVPLMLAWAAWRGRTPWLLIAWGLAFHIGVTWFMRIHLWNVAVLYVALIDWARLTRRRAAAAPLDASSSRDAPRERWWRDRHAVGALTLGIALVLGNTLNGVLHRQDWPLGLYPTFAFRAGDEIARLVITAQDATGRERVLTQRMLAEYSTVDRAAATAYQVMPEGEGDPTRLVALWTVWTRIDPSLATSRHVRFERVVSKTAPERWGEIVHRRILYELSPAAP